MARFRSECVSFKEIETLNKNKNDVFLELYLQWEIKMSFLTTLPITWHTRRQVLASPLLD